VDAIKPGESVVLQIERKAVLSYVAFVIE
jgi:hypothetical protein